MHRNRTLCNSFLSICLLTLTAHASALSEDRSKPIQVESDSAALNEKTGVIVYKGKVRITQGSMVLTGDTVTIVAPQRRLQRITSEGTPITFRQLTDDGKEIKAHAEHMEYHADVQKIILSRNAELEQGTNRFTSDLIEYQIETETIDAGGINGGSRVKMTILPAEPKPQQLGPQQPGGQ